VGKEANRRLLALSMFIETLDDSCPIKKKLQDLIEGRAK
jgi:hypothetical protein